MGDRVVGRNSGQVKERIGSRYVLMQGCGNGIVGHEKVYKGWRTHTTVYD